MNALLLAFMPFSPMLEAAAILCLIVGVVLIFVVTRKYTDKEKLQKARSQAQGYQSMPSSAFDFDADAKEEPDKK